MAGAYSTDLRERVLLAMEGGATLEAVARRFAVGRSTASRWVGGGAGGGGAQRKADGWRAQAQDQRRGRGGAARRAGGEQPAEPGRVPRPLGRAHGGPCSPLDGWASAAPDGLDVKEAESACSRAGG